MNGLTVGITLICCIIFICHYHVAICLYGISYTFEHKIHVFVIQNIYGIILVVVAL